MGQPVSIQENVWHLAGDKPLPDLTMTQLPETCVRHKAYMN